MLPEDTAKEVGNLPHRRIILDRFDKGLCALHQGSYDPHHLTGLGSALWLVERYWDHPPVAQNAFSNI